MSSSMRDVMAHLVASTTGTTLGVAAVVVLAVVTGWLTPRGPLTGPQAVVTIVAALLVGGAAGLLSRTSWSVLLAPAVYALVFEVVRSGVGGPTVDAPQLTSAVGVMAAVVGRGVHGLLVLLPLAVGAGHGARLGRRLVGAAPPARPIGATLLVVTTVGVVALAVLVAVPARTAPIVGADGRPLPGSIAEFARVQIGGSEQVVLLRGRSVDAPVLLHLAGGPGGTDLGAIRQDTGLEQHFVVATWEQRGTGRSYATSIDPVDRLTLDQAVADTLAVTDWLRARFGVERIYLTANSWGTIPSALAVQAAPDRYHAYVGTGQMVDVRETDRMFWDDALAWAERTGRTGLAQSIRAAGPPPYDDLAAYQYTVAYEHQWNAYPGVADLYEMPANVLVPENAWMDRVNAIRAMFDVNWFVYPQLQDLDLRDRVPRLDVPVVVVLGEHEARGRAVPARAWFEALDAPSKRLVVFDGAGHRPSFEDPGAFADLLAGLVADASATTS